MPLPHIALAVLVTIIWGVNFSFIAIALNDFPPIMLSALRFFLTAFPLVFFVKLPKFTFPFFVYGIGTFALQYGFMFFAMQVGASAGLSALVLQLQVFFTMILAYFLLKERIRPIQIIGMLVATVGMVLIALHLGGDMPILGLLLLIFSATGWACGNVASTQLKDVPIPTMLAWGGLMSFVSLTVISLILEPNAWQMDTLINASLSSWLALAFIVYISTFVGFGVWFWLLQRNPASQVSPFALLVPISGMIASVIILGEQITWWKVLALILILTGLIIANILPKRQKQG